MMKNEGIIFFLILAAGLMLFACKTDSEPVDKKEYLFLEGRTMGTTYHIHVNSPAMENFSYKIDSILVSINEFVSTYEENSLISRINRNMNVLDSSRGRVTLKEARNPHFETNYLKSRDVYKDSRGLFDPTVMPLVNYWGFGYKPKLAVTEVDTQQIEDILNSTGFDKWQYRIKGDSFILRKPLASEIDFSAIAKGYAVDYISEFLDTLGISDYMVEIGGEVFARGVNSKGKTWAIGLNTPREDAAYNEYEVVLSLDNQGLASSGNYRNFHVVEGRKYGHEINPQTGFPEISELLAVSVIAEKCILADAWATAYMIMGKEDALAHVNATKGLEACFFYGLEDGSIGQTFSTGFEANISEEHQSSKSESR